MYLLLFLTAVIAVSASHINRRSESDHVSRFMNETDEQRWIVPYVNSSASVSIPSFQLPTAKSPQEQASSTLSASLASRLFSSEPAYASVPAPPPRVTQGSYNATRKATSVGSSVSQAVITSAPTAVSSSCCYLWPQAVGINTWWTSSINVTVASVITTWLQYQDTLIPASSTTIIVPPDTDIYGSYRMQSSSVWIPLSATATETGTYCDRWSTDGDGRCIDFVTETMTLTEYTQLPVTSDIIPGVPNQLLPSQAILYGATTVARGTAATFARQDIVVQSPTPFFVFDRVQVFTNWACRTVATSTSIDYDYRTTIDGTATYVTKTQGSYTTTEFPPGQSPSLDFNNDEVYIGDILAKPFPAGDYSQFNFSDWLTDVHGSYPWSELDPYMFDLPDDFPQFLAGVPEIALQHPDIDSCSNIAGAGEPTVHVPVSELTVTSHVTFTLPGSLDSTPAITASPASVTTTISMTRDLTPPTTARSSSLFDSLSAASMPHETQDTILILASASSNFEQSAESGTPAATTSIVADIFPSASPFTVTTSGTMSGPVMLEPNTKTTQLALELASASASLVMAGLPLPTSVTLSTTDASPSVIVIGSATATADYASRFVFGSQTLQPGSSGVTIAGISISLSPSATAIVVDGVTTPLVAAPPATPVSTPVMNIGGELVTADSATRFIIASQTLAPGSAPIVVSRTTYSLLLLASAVVVNGRTTPLVQGTSKNPALITIAGQTIPAIPASQVAIGTQTLRPGSSGITFAGTTYSLLPSGTAIVVNGRTTPLTGGPTSATTTLTDQQRVGAGTTTAVPPILTIAGQVVTADSANRYVLGTQTLAPGSAAVVVAGTTYSLAMSETALVVDGATSQIETSRTLATITGSSASTESSSGQPATPSRAIGSMQVDLTRRGVAGRLLPMIVIGMLL